MGRKCQKKFLSNKWFLKESDLTNDAVFKVGDVLTLKWRTNQENRSILNASITQIRVMLCKNSEINRVAEKFIIMVEGFLVSYNPHRIFIGNKQHQYSGKKREIY